MKTTLRLPHSWPSLFAKARRLNMRINCEARLSVRDPREQHRDLVNEADAMCKLAESENRDFTDAEQTRFDEIMNEPDGEIIKLEASIAKAQDLLDAQKRLALARDAGNAVGYFGQPIMDLSGGGDGKPGMQFKTSDGRTLRALTSGESVAASMREQHSLGGDQVLSDEASVETFGEGIRSMLTGSTSGIQGAFVGGDDRGGLLTSDHIAPAIQDAIRAALVLMRAGTQTLLMDSPELSLAQVTQDPEAMWRAELQPVKSSDVQFGRIVLRPKMIAALVPISLELLEDARASVAQVIVSAITSAMALAIDRAALFGSGAANEPTGLTNMNGTNIIGDVGVPTGYGQISEAVQKIYAANFSGEASDLAWIASPRERGSYDNLTDSTGQPLMMPPWPSKVKPFTTTSLPTDLGDGNDEAEMILGDFSQLILGLRSGIQVRVLEAGSVSDGNGASLNAVDQFAKIIAVHMRVDVACLRPSWFSVLSGVKSS